MITATRRFDPGGEDGKFGRIALHCEDESGEP